MKLSGSLAPFLLVVFAASCQVMESRREASAMTYLYREPAAAAGEQGAAGASRRTPPPSPGPAAALPAPRRLGLAFAPVDDVETRSGFGYRSWTFGEPDKRRVLDRVRRQLGKHPGLPEVVVVPTYHMQPRGGFDDLERVAAQQQLDGMILLSYEQNQVNEANFLSITYLALLPVYFVPGNATETLTVVDADVFDVATRTHLFSASGSADGGGTCTGIEAGRSLRKQSRSGFRTAADELAAGLSEGLAGLQGS